MKPIYPKMTEADVLKGLRNRHSQVSQGTHRRWVFVTHIRMLPGFDSPRILDAFALDTWLSGGYTRIAYEVKVSPSDFSTELANPKKRDEALRVSNLFYFAVPSGMKGEASLPEEAGLIWVNANGSSRIIRRAPRRQVGPMDMDFVISLLRANQNAPRRPSPALLADAE